MNALKGAGSNDRLFCWEQVTRTNQAFRVSQVFAPREEAAKLLPLYALFSIVEQICSVSSDEDLACSKLDWWRIECSQQNLQSSHHPVLKEFRRTGARHSMGQDQFQSLLDSAKIRLEARAPDDISDLKALCIATQRPQFDLEMSVSGLGVDSVQANPGLLARGGLLQLIRESAKRSGQGAYWWIPLNLLARYGVNRDALVTEPESKEVSGLLTELITESASWVPSQYGAPEKDKAFQALRNYFAINGLYSKKISNLINLSPNRYVTEFNRIRVSDLFVAWRCARRLQC
jgi:hypothetical protein